jgi:hypothetical protein
MQEPDMVQLSTEEMALLDVLIEEKAAREQILIPNRTIVRRFEKYAFPIGVDEAGSRFPLPPWRDDRDDA